MRRLLLLGALALLLVLPATSLADRPVQPRKGPPAGVDGCLVVSGANGIVTIWAQGGLIGRVGSGTVTIEDLDPGDSSKGKVFGADSRIDLTKTKTQYVGSPSVRFRFTGGGSFHVVLNAIDIDFSLVGRGRAVLNGAGITQQGGTYSADSESLCADAVKPFPETPTRVVFGTAGTG
jgi:hypothetical protein